MSLIIKKKGFTLVELLAVVVVLGVILSIAVPTATNIINNSKEKAFIYDAKAYIEAARYNVQVGNVEKAVYSLKELDIKANDKNSYMGVVYAEKKDNNVFEYSIFILDTATNRMLGTAVFDKPRLVNENKINISMINNAEFSSELLKSNLDFTENVVSFERINDDGKVTQISRDAAGNIVELTSDISVGNIIYLRYGDDCKPVTVIDASIDSIMILDPRTTEEKMMSIKTLSENGGADSYFRSKYSQRYNIPEEKLKVRLLAISDLYYFIGIDDTKKIISSKILNENKEKIAKLFGPEYNDWKEFYRKESENRSLARFISLGTYGLNDYCRADGTTNYIKNSSTDMCYAFRLGSVYKNSGYEGKSEVREVTYQRGLIINNIVTIEDYGKYSYTDNECKVLYKGASSSENSSES